MEVEDLMKSRACSKKLNVGRKLDRKGDSKKPNGSPHEAGE
jgi:hypothetical protein